MPAEDQKVPREEEDIAQERSFDELAKELANGTTSRGQALKWLMGTLLGVACWRSFLGQRKPSCSSEEVVVAVGTTTIIIGAVEAEGEAAAEEAPAVRPGPSRPRPPLPKGSVGVLR